MAKLSKQVDNRLTVSGKVVAAERTHRTAIAEALAARAAEAQGAGTKATAEVFAIALEAQSDMLETAANNLRATELAYVAEQADDVVLRERREALTVELTGLMTRLRSTVEDALGATGLATYGLEGPTPRAPRAVASHAINVVMLMEKQPASVTTALGSTFDTKVVTAAISPKAEALDQVLRDLDREARELEGALGKREEALKAWTSAYQGTATALEGAFRLGGRPDLAERVKPTSRTVSGEEAGPEGEAERAPEGGTGKGTP